SFPSRRRLAPVEAEDEFVEVILEVLVPDGSLVCSEHPPLEQGNRSVDSWKHMLPVLETTLDLPVMDVSFYLTVGVEPVSANRTPGFHRRSDEAMKRCPVEIGDSCHADATDAFAVLLGCDDDQHLAVDHAAGCSPRFGCAPVGFIYLHHASQTLRPGRTIVWRSLGSISHAVL